MCKLIKRDKANYQSNLIEKFKDHPKQFYGYMRNMSTVRTSVSAITKQDGTLTTTDSETAAVSWDYFSSTSTIVAKLRPNNLSVPFQRSPVHGHGVHIITV